jgi:hypothetical protein
LVFSQAQEASGQVTYDLQIDSLVGIPDTVENGQVVDFFVQISLNSPLIYQGEVFLELEYGGNFYPVDTTISQNFLSPNFPNTVQAQHRFSTDDDLNIGDNVVVVWPRIGDGENPPQTVSFPFETTVTIAEPNGIGESSSQRVFQTFIRPNPASDRVELSLDADISIAYSRLFDITGTMVLESNNQRTLELSSLPTGIYFLDVLTEDGHVFTDKLMIAR